MASANKTPNLNLPQWVGTEKPERTDFNAAFLAIDQAAPVLAAPFNLTPQNGWAAQSFGTYGNLRAYTDRGRVYIQGVMRGADATSDTITTLAEALRPSRQLVFPCVTTHGEIVLVKVHTDGRIQTANRAIISLSSINYRPDMVT